MNAELNTIANRYPQESRKLLVLLCITLILFATGVYAPLITLNKFIVIENTFSIFTGTIELLQEGRIFLFIVITTFSILLPLLKILILFQLLLTKSNQASSVKRILHWMHLFGKWSMLDVFVVAVLVVTVKLGVIASVETRYGLYAFTAAVLLTMFITARVTSLSNQNQKSLSCTTSH